MNATNQLPHLPTSSTAGQVWFRKLVHSPHHLTPQQGNHSHSLIHTFSRHPFAPLPACLHSPAPQPPTRLCTFCNEQQPNHTSPSPCFHTEEGPGSSSPRPACLHRGRAIPFLLVFTLVPRPIHHQQHPPWRKDLCAIFHRHH